MKLAENLWEKALVSETTIYTLTTVFSRNWFVVHAFLYFSIGFSQEKRLSVDFIM